MVMETTIIKSTRPYATRPIWCSERGEGARKVYFACSFVVILSPMMSQYQVYTIKQILKFLWVVVNLGPL